MSPTSCTWPAAEIKGACGVCAVVCGGRDGPGAACTALNVQQLNGLPEPTARTDGKGHGGAGGEDGLVDGRGQEHELDEGGKVGVEEGVLCTGEEVEAGAGFRGVLRLSLRGDGAADKQQHGNRLPGPHPIDDCGKGEHHRESYD